MSSPSEPTRNGCYNRAAFAEKVVVQDGYQTLPFSRPTDPRLEYLVEIPFVMARDCQYTLSPLGAADTRCTGCIHHFSNKRTAP